MTPDEALRRLQDGNARFTAGSPIHSRVSREALTHLAGQQKPLAVILGCSDSRVPPELVFDQGFGDLFVIRLAGNVIAPGIFGSIQYAFRHLGAKLLVVLGHDGCGAVKATLATMFHKEKHPERIQQLVEMIKPGLRGIDPEWSVGRQLEAAVEANVRWSIREMVRTPEAQQAFKEKQLATGKVRWLDGAHTR